MPHPMVPNLTNVEVLYLPPNTTSHTQPCDQWIIQAFKVKYRSQLLSTRLLSTFIDSLEDEVPFRASVLDAILLLHTAWSEVSSTTIKKFFSSLWFCHDADKTSGEEEQTGGEVNDAL